MRNLAVTIYSVCITFHLSQLTLHNCSDEISGTFKMSRILTNGRLCLRCDFAMPPHSVQPCLRRSPILKPLPPGVMCGHSLALGLLHHAGAFYETHWFLNTPHPHPGGKDLNRELILIVTGPNPCAASTVTDLQKGQRNYLSRHSVRRIWLLVPLLICEFDEFFNMSAQSFC